MLVPEYLTPQHCLDLAHTMRLEDIRECYASGHTPLEALLTGLSAGYAIAVCRDSTGTCVGAFGVNLEADTIWSLWASRLSWQEQFQLLKQTPSAVRGLVALAGCRRLHNLVDIRNKTAIEWLERSGCFHLDTDTIEQYPQGSFLRFVTKEGTP